MFAKKQAMQYGGVYFILLRQILLEIPGSPPASLFRGSTYSVLHCAGTAGSIIKESLTSGIFPRLVARFLIMLFLFYLFQNII